MIRSLLLILVSLASASTFAQEVDWSDFNATAGITIETNLGEKSVCSGVFLNSSTLLTAAHCLQTARFIRVSTDKELKPRTALKAHDWISHPDYRGNKLGSSVDLGLVFLEKPLKSNLNWPQFAFHREDRRFERIGFGLREGSNKRTHIVSYFEEAFDGFLKLVDHHGMPGDSGGPVYQRRFDKLVLIGIHTGRALDSNGKPVNSSFVQLIDQNMKHWINTQLLP